jgi:hypothetical protein
VQETNETEQNGTDEVFSYSRTGLIKRLSCLFPGNPFRAQAQEDELDRLLNEEVENINPYTNLLSVLCLVLTILAISGIPLSLLSEPWVMRT